MALVFWLFSTKRALPSLVWVPWKNLLGFCKVSDMYQQLRHSLFMMFGFGTQILNENLDLSLERGCEDWAALKKNVVSQIKNRCLFEKIVISPSVPLRFSWNYYFHFLSTIQWCAMEIIHQSISFIEIGEIWGQKTYPKNTATLFI